MTLRFKTYLVFVYILYVQEVFSHFMYQFFMHNGSRLFAYTLDNTSQFLQSKISRLCYFLTPFISSYAYFEGSEPFLSSSFIQFRKKLVFKKCFNRFLDNLGNNSLYCTFQPYLNRHMEAKHSTKERSSFTYLSLYLSLSLSFSQA